MPKYEIVLERTTYYSLIVEADSAEEAFVMSKDTDIEKFAENNTEWHQNEAELVD